jgi:SAM-dependent methyltransferase
MDPRASTAAYYDLAPDFPDDIPFYLAQLGDTAPTVLELGCGTGRVSVALASRVSFLHGVDLSPAMISRCEDRLRRAGLPASRVTASVGDITRLALDRQFDLVLAPYRVMQNLATDQQVAGMFAGIRDHLAAGGQAILNVFRPYAEPAVLVDKWRVPGEDIDWVLPAPGGRVVCSVRRAGFTSHPLVLRPELVYRRYQGEILIDEAVSPIAMRCWYPDEFLARIRDEGFQITGQWGGYAGESYGTGSELIVAFTQV